MPSAVLEVLADPAAVAERVAECLLQAARQSPGLPLGLATGRTMVPVYAALVRRVEALAPPSRNQLLGHWRSFNLDEYVGLGPDQRQSFAAYMADHLGGPLGLAQGQLQLPNGLAADPGAEADRYSAELARSGGIGLQLLGLGSNGHIGFHAPPCAADAPCRCLELSPATRLQNAGAFGGDPAAVPARAITLGTGEILAAQAVLLVVTGTDKAAMLKRCLEEPPCAERPASWLQRHPRLQVVVDTAAAAALTRSP